MLVDLDLQLQFLHQLTTYCSLKVLASFNPSTRKADQSWCANQVRTANDEESIVFMKDAYDRVPSLISRLALLNRFRGLLGGRIMIHNIAVSWISIVRSHTPPIPIFFLLLAQ